MISNETFIQAMLDIIDEEGDDLVTCGGCKGVLPELPQFTINMQAHHIWCTVVVWAALFLGVPIPDVHRIDGEWRIWWGDRADDPIKFDLEQMASDREKDRAT